MKALGLVSLVVALAEFRMGLATSQVPLCLVAACTLAGGLACWLSPGSPRLVRILVAFFQVESVIFGAGSTAKACGYWPAALSWLPVPETLPITVAVFGVACRLILFWPIARRALLIADRYFETNTTLSVSPPWFSRTSNVAERSVAAILLVGVLLLNQIEVALGLVFYLALSDIADAMQLYDTPRFWHVITVQYPLFLLPLLVVNFANPILYNTLQILWRKWLTKDYASRWLSAHTHYRMSLGKAEADNPDQRIQEDIPAFISSGATSGASGVQRRLGVLGAIITFVFNFSSLASYSFILWNLSAVVVGTQGIGRIPGLLLWGCVLYAVLNTQMASRIGHSLARLTFSQQHFEANLRFSLSRMREYAEQIALLGGEPAELTIIDRRLSFVVRNFFSMFIVESFISVFIYLVEVVSQILPYILLGTLFFSHRLSMGTFTQSFLAFYHVNQSLNVFTDLYSPLAAFKAVIDRLSTFDTAIDAFSRPHSDRGTRTRGGDAYVASNVRIDLDGGRVLSGRLDLRLDPGQHVMISGPSGIGKSTLFRVLADIWPHWSGTITMPATGTTTTLPQRPYLPMGALTTVVSYPEADGTYSPAALQRALADVGLDHLDPEMDVDWAQRLSGGEQQRLAIARVLLSKPSWLFLDEATSALDPISEDKIYRTLASRLPETTIVSIAHRESLRRYHQRHLRAVAAPDGGFVFEECMASS